MPTNYTKAEIQFWWDPSDNAIHVTTKPGSTPRPLHTTFPYNEDSVRWHRSFFTWLVEMLKAEGKSAPTVDASQAAEFRIRLGGKMWWNDPAKPGRLDEFVLFADRLAFAVTDMEERGSYQGTLRRSDTDPKVFKGSVSFVGGTGRASCELTEDKDGTFLLSGKWSQSTSPETFDWNAELEPEDE